MGCHNCEDGKVALTNNDGQVYEFRNCPLCSCKTCDGTGYMRDWGVGVERSVRPCWRCRPDRFDAHVEAYRAKEYLDDFIEDLEVSNAGMAAIWFRPTYGDPNPAALQRNVQQFVKSYNYYERIYRRCLNPFQRFCRWLTHNPDGSKRNG